MELHKRWRPALSPAALVGGLLLGLCLRAESGLSAAEPVQPDAARAFGYLERVCAIGPRISGTRGMILQQELLVEHFQKLGAETRFQEFDVPHPESGEPVRMKNLIVSWHPDSKDRVLLCCHYDTRPYPDRELLPSNQTKPFIGANDGGSGAALFMELAHHIPRLRPRTGLDFVLFDGEELIYRELRDRYFIGSEYFARDYRDNPPEYRYGAGILVDMIGDKDLRIFQEVNSYKFARELTDSVWESASAVGAREFVARRKHLVRDDHLALNQIARIPSIDLIDFDYPYWHKRNDVPAACSGESLAIVGRVLIHWLEHMPGKR